MDQVSSYFSLLIFEESLRFNFPRIRNVLLNPKKKAWSIVEPLFHTSYQCKCYKYVTTLILKTIFWSSCYLVKDSTEVSVHELYNGCFKTRKWLIWFYSLCHPFQDRAIKWTLFVVIDRLQNFKLLIICLRNAF